MSADKNEHKKHLLQVSNLHFFYGENCALRDISFEVQCGSSLAIIGANGAGKSTLLKLIVSLLTPTRGHIMWRGKAFKKSSHEIAYLPQREDIDWSFPLTVKGLVEMGRFPHLGLLKSFSPDDAKIVQQSIKQMELDEFENRQIRKLSGGQQQRAFIARSLAQESHVLVLDEPFNNLDKHNQKNLSELIKKMSKLDRLIIASCHEMDIVENTFEYILKLDRELISFKKNHKFNKIIAIP